MPHLRQSLVCIAIFLVFAASSTVVAGSDSGVLLPHPLSIPRPLVDDSLFSGFGSPIQQFTLTISASGAIEQFETDRLVGLEWRKRMTSYLQRFSFSPGRSGGKTTTFELVVRCAVDIGDSLLLLEFPCDTTGRIHDPLLYERNLEQAGVTLPSLVTFPWYHAVFRNPDSVKLMPYALVALEMDRNGRCRKTHLVSSNYPSFREQFVSASLYGTYRPGNTPGGKEVRRGFLLAAFIPTTHYPTKPWTKARCDSLEIHDQLSLRLVVDTTGLIFPPLPVSRAPIAINSKLPRVERETELALRIKIGDDGHVRTYVSPVNAYGLYPLAMAMDKQLRFYPAIGSDGKPRIFDTVVLVRQEGASTVRISFPWLDSTDPR